VSPSANEAGFRQLERVRRASRRLMLLTTLLTTLSRLFFNLVPNGISCIGMSTCSTSFCFLQSLALAVAIKGSKIDSHITSKEYKTESLRQESRIRGNGDYHLTELSKVRRSKTEYVGRTRSLTILIALSSLVRAIIRRWVFPLWGRSGRRGCAPLQPKSLFDQFFTNI